MATRVAKTVEGAFSVKAIQTLFPNLDLPITHAVYQALYHKIPIKDLLNNLFERPVKLENHDSFDNNFQ